MAIRKEGTIIKFIYRGREAPVESITVTDARTNIEFSAIPTDNISLINGGYVTIPTRYNLSEVRVDIKFSKEECIIRGVEVECEDSAYIPVITSIGYHSFVLDLTDCYAQKINCTIDDDLRSDASDIPLSLRLLKTPSGKLIKSKGGKLRCVHYDIDAGLPSGRKYSLRELQKKNPIQVGSYLGVIYWDGKGSTQPNSWIYVGSNSHLSIEGGKLDVTVNGVSKQYSEPGYIVVDGTVIAIQDNATNFLSHIAALELHKAGVGDKFSRFYWDGVSELGATSCVYNSYIAGAYQYIKGINATTIQYGIGDGTKQVNLSDAGWYSISNLSKGEFSSIPVNVVDRAGAKPVLWVPGLPSATSTQPMMEESKAVAMAIDHNGTPIVTKVVNTKKKVVI